MGWKEIVVQNTDSPLSINFDHSSDTISVYFVDFRGRRRTSKSVFDGFRDFQAEASEYYKPYK